MGNLIKITTDGVSVSGTAQTITESALVSGGNITVGNILEVILSVKKVVTTSVLTIRLFINTSNSLTGATQISIYQGVAGSQYGYIFGRNFIVKNSSSTIGFSSTTGSVTPDVPLTSAYGDFNIDWSIDQYFIIALNHSSGTGSNSYSTSLLVLKR